MNATCPAFERNRPDKGRPAKKKTVPKAAMHAKAPPRKAAGLWSAPRCSAINRIGIAISKSEALDLTNVAKATVTPAKNTAGEDDDLRNKIQMAVQIRAAKSMSDMAEAPN